jgi:hypothetical protein
MQDPFISQSYYELSLCPYMNALEEAEEDDFEELGSFDGESIATDSESTSDEFFDSSICTPTLKVELAGRFRKNLQLVLGMPPWSADCLSQSQQAAGYAQSFLDQIDMREFYIRTQIPSHTNILRV